MQSAIKNQEDTDNTIYNRLVRLWLATILLILPFQMTISTYIAPWSSKASTIINNLDELTIVVFLLLAIGEFYKLKKLPNNLFFFCLSL
jgi:heme/copper-type cytochrome/quinol oxidase subunit 4